MKAKSPRPRQGGLSDYTDVPHYESPSGSFVSLFAGAGGMDLGFALAGFRPVWVNEIDPLAAGTNELALKKLSDERPHLGGPDWRVSVEDILSVADRDLPRRGSADLVIGGPPCQGFSVAGKMDPEDERSRHVFHFMDMVDRVRPRAFVMENVKHLCVNHRWGGVREQLTLASSKLGYNSEFFLCNASHFGVPQARERMFFVGVRGTQPLPPSPSSQSRPPTLRDALSQLPALGRTGNHSTCTAKVTAATAPVMRRSPYAGMMFNGAGRPMNLDMPAPTLPASMGGNKTPIVDQLQLEEGASAWIEWYHGRLWNGGRPLKRVPARMRRITVEEAAAIQTFPLGTDWQGPLSAQYRQIGNAVPPRLALAMADAVRLTLRTPEGRRRRTH